MGIPPQNFKVVRAVNKKQVHLVWCKPMCRLVKECARLHPREPNTSDSTVEVERGRTTKAPSEVQARANKSWFTVSTTFKESDAK